MTKDFTASLLHFGLAFVPALFGIICHEVSHGLAAYKMGDPTARYMGRLTLNPIKHIDPMGLGVFVFTALFSPFIIGWAKPVPVQTRYFKNPRRDMILVSLAGPLSNVFVACLCALILKLSLNLAQAGLASSSILLLVAQSAWLGIGINCALCWFNLMPIPPLDGSHILAGILPRQLAMLYTGLSRYGMLVVILLLATGFFRYVLVPLISYSVFYISLFFQVPYGLGQVQRFFFS
ncbi:MAG: site-2 protease family protein [Desulfovibrio sp.]|jgi:Zn-dependent protease|nr:site-2 protease family protein [Desulfovibrio sp.]